METQPENEPIEMHELALAFNEMDAATYYELVESIRCAGLLQPIIIVDGKIVDGRHRYKACLETGVEPRFEDWSGGSREDLVRLVTANNLTRRHETDTQRAITTVKLAMMGLGTRSELAATMKVKERVLNRAFRVFKNGSDNVIELVSAGKMSLRAAEMEVTGSAPDKPANPRGNRLVTRLAKAVLEVEKCLERSGEITDKWQGNPDVTARMRATANRLTKLAMTIEEDDKTSTAA